MPARQGPRKIGARVLAVACLVLIAAHWIVILHRRASQLGDFDVSREFGRRFLDGEHLYAGGLHYPYPPAAALSFAPFALVPPTAGLLVRYLAAIACLGLTLHLLHAMTRQRSVALAGIQGALSVITIVLGSHYLIRDLDDGGPHLILLAMTVAGVYCVRRGRPALGGVWFGLGAALKAPQAIVLPFLVWKREWRVAAWTAAATAGWMLLPAVWMGPASWWSHQREWTQTVVASVLGHPAGGAKESEERLQNQALRPVVMRYVAAFAAGRDRGIEGSSSRAFEGAGEEPPVEANAESRGRVVSVLAILGVVAAFAWWTRRRYRGWADPRWPLEASAVMLLALLASPATWIQHMVLVIPALYLIVAEERGLGRLGGLSILAMIVYVVLSLLLNREFLGRECYLVLLSYGTHTACLLLLLAVLLLREPTAQVSASR